MKDISVPKIHRRFFDISFAETDFVKRGFRISEKAKVEHLERAGKSFLHGYKMALKSEENQTLATDLNQVEKSYQGFAFEGAAMALTLLDCIFVWQKPRLQDFYRAEGNKHIYMIHVGAGWAMARLPWKRHRILKSIANLDPLLKWLAIDGFGFHEGYFHPKKYYRSNLSLTWLPLYSQRAFAQGLGRSLWFVEGAEIKSIAQTISVMPKKLHEDLWSGIGLACAYAGGITRDEYQELKLIAKEFHPQLAQGVAFASRTRQRAENVVEHTKIACQVICGADFEEIASVPELTQNNLPDSDAQLPAYEIWRQRIQQELALEVVNI